MLYQFHEMQRAVMEPWRWWAQANVDAFGSAFSPLSFAPAAKNVTAGMDLMLRLTARYGRPAFDIGSVKVNGVDATVTEEVLFEKPFCNLLHFKKSRSAKNEPTAILQRCCAIPCAPCCRITMW
jgi:poly(3-hydroxybutyrate) depolymerase